ncbi:uncharacterized protein BO96DRAFT_477505 [Aspergillus niger CBS 101883]|uniref:Contig An03c0100, genomic contig n=3 Tax=Aspergillus niger TaxID=5061 RepID=A2QGG6_ASPNC|nr:uncharacterized protein BO96DRAFT_477505 [Aspergillus niger CBS 101883]XP_059603583.1 uncharacterized protein An03g03090 [Aspergillus niger]PYH55018.1 hypothetical protein BO96DRAFT_477505 [Aspergillus niger CBS 101883]RDH19443.1 hypothetical protein M747DRAFT_315625 [Aspergillus niger ATCC 13496]CAK44608.1 unnamed protein product [Aspergillus niger]
MFSSENQEKSPVSRVYPDQPSSDTSRTYEAHASASMEGHRWSVSDMGRASDVATPKDSGTERGSPTTCPADVTVRGEWNEIRDDGNSTLPYQIGDNAGWGPPSSATTLPNSFMSANHSTGNPTADPWHLMPWASEPYSWETLPASFWGWTWSQSEYLTGSETDGFSHPSIPAPQAAGWSFGGEAEQPQYPTRSGITHFWGDGSQVLYNPSLSFDPPEPFPSSDALGLSSILKLRHRASQDFLACSMLRTAAWRSRLSLQCYRVPGIHWRLFPQQWCQQTGVIVSCHGAGRPGRASSLDLGIRLQCSQETGTVCVVGTQKCACLYVFEL